MIVKAAFLLPGNVSHGEMKFCILNTDKGISDIQFLFEKGL